MSFVMRGFSPSMIAWYQPRQRKATQVMKLKREVREDVATAVLDPWLPRKKKFNTRLG